MRIRPLTAHTKEDLMRELSALGWATSDDVAADAACKVLWVSGLAPEEVAWLRQALVAGVQVLMPETAVKGTAILLATETGLLALADSAKAQGLRALADAVRRLYHRLTTPPSPLRIGPLLCECHARQFQR